VCYFLFAGSRGKPYYFGTTKLFCGKKGKRAPSRNTWLLRHRWILYDGWFFEFGVTSNKGAQVGTVPKDGDKCNPRRESSPAGYGKVSRECLKRCALNYARKYGSYNVLFNNCHDFANEMSKILCNYSSCPSWC